MVSAHLTGQKTSGGNVVPTLYAGRVDMGAIKLINQLFARGNTWEEAYNNGYDYPVDEDTSGQTFFCRQQDYFGRSSNDPLHATNQNCCTNDRCFPHAREQFTGVSNGSSIPFAIINHGRDGRGAFPRIPRFKTQRIPRGFLQVSPHGAVLDLRLYAQIPLQSARGVMIGERGGEV
jgi:hypothetical protein